MMIHPSLLPNEPEAEAILNGERALDLVENLRFVMRRTQLENWPPSRIEAFRCHLAEVIAVLGPSR